MYALRNKITDHLNIAAGLHAIERGYGATIIGSGKGSSTPLYTKFLETARAGDSEVSNAEEFLEKLITLKKCNVFEERINRWHKGYEALTNTRDRIKNRDISKNEWMAIATANINNEFGLCNIITPQNDESEITYLNDVVRRYVAKLNEYAGLERALLGNVIASEMPLSNKAINAIKYNRSIVDKSIDQVLLFILSSFSCLKLRYLSLF